MNQHQKILYRTTIRMNLGTDIKRLNLYINTNIPGNRPFPLTYQTLWHPPMNTVEENNASDSITDDDETDSDKIKPDAKPYFTDENKYELSKIDALSIENRRRCFFDLALFKRILSPNTETIDETQKHANANHNIIIMLQILFTSTFMSSQSQSITTSFDEFILRQNSAVTQSVFILPDFIKNALSSNPYKMSYIVIGGTTYTVTKSIWLNDILNNPQYQILFQRLVRTNQWIEKKIEEYTQKIIPNLQKTYETNRDVFRDYIYNPAQFATLNARIDQQMNDIDRKTRQSQNSTYAPFARKIRGYIDEIMVDPPLDNDQFDEIIRKFYQYEKRRLTSFQLIPADFRIGLYVKMMNSLKILILHEKIIEYLNDPSKYSTLRKLKQAISNKNNISSSNQYFDSELYTKLTSEYEFQQFQDIFRLLNPYIMHTISVGNPLLESIFMNFAEPDTYTSSITLFGTGGLIRYVEEQFIKEQQPKYTSNITFPSDIQKALEVGVVIIKKSAAKDKNKDQDKDQDIDIFSEVSDEVAEIYVSLNLARGVLTKDSIKQINCPYKNMRLKSLYKQLKSQMQTKSTTRSQFFTPAKLLVLPQSSQRVKNGNPNPNRKSKKAQPPNMPNNITRRKVPNME